jgi:hypothetical protein
MAAPLGGGGAALLVVLHGNDDAAALLAPLGRDNTALLLALHCNGAAGLSFFLFYFCEITKKRPVFTPLDPPSPPLGSSVPTRESPIRGGPTRIGSKFLILDCFNLDRPSTPNPSLSVAGWNLDQTVPDRPVFKPLCTGTVRWTWSGW